MKLLLSFSLIVLSLLPDIRAEVSNSVLRVSSTLQRYNPSQPWDKLSPIKRRGLGALLKDNKVLTTAEMVTDVNFIEFETTDGTHNLPAKVVAVDYESNLALLTPTTAKGIEVISAMKPLELAPAAKLGDSLQVVQIEENGMPLVTEGKVQSADVVASFVKGQYFLTYEVKASMQSAASSYTIPVLHNEKLLGLLTSYSSKDQLLDVIAPEIISAFLKDAADGSYEGFPSLGVSTSRTTDDNFRSYLKLPKEQGGLYINRVKPNSTAAIAGVLAGDVLLAVDGHPIDRRGYYKANGYGRLHWIHLVRGSKPIGESVSLSIFRDGKTLTLETTLARSPEGIIPTHTYGKAPRYLVKGGFIFQELTQSYLQAYGKDWASKAPLTLLDALNHPEDYEHERKRLVFLSATLPTPATLGYESIGGVIIEKVNGQPIQDIPSLIKAFETPQLGLHTIELSDIPKTLYLDAASSDEVDQMLTARGLPALSREKE